MNCNEMQAMSLKECIKEYMGGLEQKKGKEKWYKNVKCTRSLTIMDLPCD